MRRHEHHVNPYETYVKQVYTRGASLLLLELHVAQHSTAETQLLLPICQVQACLLSRRIRGCLSVRQLRSPL